MKMITSLKMATAALALISAPLFANAKGYDMAHCHFDGDVEQDGDCYAKIVSCFDNTPSTTEPMALESNEVDSEKRCVSFMRLRCENRTLFYGGFRLSNPSEGTTLASGIPNDQYRTAAHVLLDNPTSLPARVSASMSWGELERSGICDITRHLSNGDEL